VPVPQSFCKQFQNNILNNGQEIVRFLYNAFFEEICWLGCTKRCAGLGKNLDIRGSLIFPPNIYINRKVSTSTSTFLRGHLSLRATLKKLWTLTFSALEKILNMRVPPITPPSIYINRKVSTSTSTVLRGHLSLRATLKKLITILSDYNKKL